MRRFIVLCNSRTGSQLLCRAIAQHPAALVHLEVLTPDVEARRRHFSVAGRCLAEDEDGAAFLREIVFVPRRPEHAAVGFKLMYFHARSGPAASAWSHLVADRDVAVIHLVRDDLLANLVSLEVALRSDQWQLASDSSEPVRTVPPFALEAERCREYFERISGWIAGSRAQFAGHSVLPLEYQRDLVERFAATMESVWALLGLPAQPVDQAIRVQRRRTPREQLSNYDALAAQFAGTPYARLFGAHAPSRE